MKRTVLFFVFAVVSIIANAQFTEYVPFTPNNTYSQPSSSDLPFAEYIPFEGIRSGKTYNAVVFYESSAGTENTYTLPVIVNKGYVNEICFDNGGSVHTGSNSYGYKYYGGKLEYVGDINAYAAVVTIVYSRTSWYRYTVVIDRL